ncbi:MAG: S8 family serine peptidase, partial [Bacteroidota bacterium]
SYPTVISVGGLSPCDTRKTLTSCDGEFFWGSSYGGGEDKMDFVAPSARITTTDISRIYDVPLEGYIDSFWGTSAACPFAAVLPQ